MSWNGCIGEGKMASTSIQQNKTVKSCLVPKHLQQQQYISNFNNCNTPWNQNSALLTRAASNPTQLPIFNQPYFGPAPTPNQHFNGNSNLSPVHQKPAHQRNFYPSSHGSNWRPTHKSSVHFEFDTDSSESDLTDSEPMEIDPVETIDYWGEGASSNTSIYRNFWPRCGADNLKSHLRVPSIHMKARHIYIQF